jgi:hypothetical protein
MKVFRTKVTMVKPFFDSYLLKPSNADVLEDFADLIASLDSVKEHFKVEVEEVEVDEKEVMEES